MCFYFTYLMADIFGIIDLNIMLLGAREFREDLCTENGTLLRV